MKSLMFKLILIGALTLSITLSLYASSTVGGRIDMSVSPIRDEFNIERWTPVTRTIQYSNNSDVPYNIFVTVEDCAPSGNYGTPICKKPSGSGVQDEFSSTWITLSETNFVVPPRTNKTISYTVKAPLGAAPGGHYGAIFFNNPDTPVMGSNTVGMIRRIGMLYMMKIPGSIIVDPSLGSILVDGPGGGMSGEGTVFTYFTFNSAPELIDKIRKNWNSTPMWEEILDTVNPIWDKPFLENDNFSLSLKVPVKNDGNIHIKPTGKVYLFDENGTQLENVGKESIVDENGVYIGENIVNYLPINDERGNVLPNTERVFEVNWLGFGYEEKNPETGKYEIQFETPGEYYSRLTEEDTRYIYPWERLSIKKVSRTLKAKVEFTYNNVVTGEDVTEIMEIPVTVNYSYIAKTINYGILFVIGFILIFAWIFISMRDRRIEYLEEENTELEDEISVLERAKNTHTIKAKTKSKTEKVKAVPEAKNEGKKPIMKNTKTEKEIPKTDTAEKAPAVKRTRKTTTKKTDTTKNTDTPPVE